ncbi:MAG: hypothetical protein D6734_05705 [Candidatus Schekmanbacteria bacterium]|nr:MAG: hypothetical protein D6734_05705 [Candidatus Schekmanbacteria bacterium]
MGINSLPEYCFEVLSKEIELRKVEGLEDIETLKLPDGKDGGSIKKYTAEGISTVAQVHFKFGDGIPVAHRNNQIVTDAELFIIRPDFSRKVPSWGINTVIAKDGTYYFDTDFSFGFDLVTDYEFTMKYLDPFTPILQDYAKNKGLNVIPFYEWTTWVRTHTSPVFMIAETTIDNSSTVQGLASEYIKLWVKIFKEAEIGGEELKNQQESRIRAQMAGMRDTDRMGKVIRNVYGEENFVKFFKALA